MTEHSKLLMVAYDFPPRLSAGVHRTLKFAQHLPSHGWEPIVVTTTAGAYERRDESVSLPEGLEVRRAWSCDASRRLAIAGRYLTITCTPDRFSSWFPFAVRAGRAAIKDAPSGRDLLDLPDLHGPHGRGHTGAESRVALDR